MTDSNTKSNIADVSDEQENTTHDELNVIATNVSPETADEHALPDGCHVSSDKWADADIE